MLRSLSLLGVALAMALSVAAQDQPKVKMSDKETKYKSDDLKIKDKKEEEKYKTADLKVKDEGVKTKVKGMVRPMHITKTERTEIRTGESDVKVTDHILPLPTETVETVTPVPAVTQQLAVPDAPTVAAKPVHHRVHRYAVSKNVPAKRVATKYVVRTKVVRDTVYVPSPPEKLVSTQTEYVHDTVSVTRVDTFLKYQKENTYTGYQVPRGNFKKVKLKKDKDDEVWMKRKGKDKDK